MSATVALVRCEDYERENLQQAVSKLLGQLGGWEEFVKAGERVLIKPNFIAPRGPDVPAQTDGRLVAAIARQLGQLGAKVLVGDSTAWGSLRKNAALAGLDKQTLAKVGAELVKFNRPCRVTIQTSAGPRKVAIDQTALEVDKIINVPKFKAHQQLVLSGALKNAFGAVGGKRKAWWHCRYGQVEVFTDMIVGVYQKIGPVLNIVDAIMAMEGRGPTGGTPRKVGVLMASADAAAVDRVACEIMGALAEDVAMLAAARRARVGVTELADIELVGEDIEQLRVKDFVLPELVPIKFTLGRIFKSVARQVRILWKERRESGRTG